MTYAVGGEDARTLVNFALLLVPASLYGLGIMRGRAGKALFLAGLLLHAAGMVIRGLEIGTVPLTEKHDTISFMAFSMALAYWYAVRRKGAANLDLMALPMIVVFMVVSFKHAPINTISPFMMTPWFYVHAFFFFASYGCFGISACVGVLHLLGGGEGLEGLQYRGTMYGWVLFTFALVGGSLWFYMAHGTYWLWTSKELWTALTWFFYGLYLHARLMRGLRGWPASALGIAGFAVALFTYFGVGTVIPSPPTQF